MKRDILILIAAACFIMGSVAIVRDAEKAQLRWYLSHQPINK